MAKVETLFGMRAVDVQTDDPGYWALVNPTSRHGWVEIIDSRDNHLCMPLPGYRKEPTDGR